MQQYLQVTSCHIWRLNIHAPLTGLSCWPNCSLFAGWLFCLAWMCWCCPSLVFSVVSGLLPLGFVTLTMHLLFALPTLGVQFPIFILRDSIMLKNSEGWIFTTCVCYHLALLSNVHFCLDTCSDLKQSSDGVKFKLCQLLPTPSVAKFPENKLKFELVKYLRAGPTNTDSAENNTPPCRRVLEMTVAAVHWVTSHLNILKDHRGD